MKGSGSPPAAQHGTSITRAPNRLAHQGALLGPSTAYSKLPIHPERERASAENRMLSLMGRHAAIVGRCTPCTIVASRPCSPPPA